MPFALFVYTIWRVRRQKSIEGFDSFGPLNGFDLARILPPITAGRYFTNTLVCAPKALEGLWVLRETGWAQSHLEIAHYKYLHKLCAQGQGTDVSQSIYG
ncbi:hypothetical protein AMECASPLE_019068 [Ameca splendens]|uniref:Uncharacterized protein n=1 Tax=Ameca splendens TaxID=208324 RepID=A0ABV0ZC59_9TELE